MTCTTIVFAAIAAFIIVVLVLAYSALSRIEADAESNEFTLDQYDEDRKQDPSLYGVWLDLVEKHWDMIRRQQHAAQLTFSYSRRQKLRDKESIDKELASLACDYWKRNRFHLREEFVNWCYFMSKKAYLYEIDKAANGSRKIPCKVKADPEGWISPFDVDETWIDQNMPICFHKRKAYWLLDNSLSQSS